MSSGAFTFMGRSSIRNEPATRAMAVRAISPLGLAGFTRTPSRTVAGTASLISSTRFAQISAKKKVNPVRFPPGRAILGTSPEDTKSAAAVTTIGIVELISLFRRAGPGRTMGHDDIDLRRDQLAGEGVKTIVISLGELIVDGNILS